jgi:hypothetical protein
MLRASCSFRSAKALESSGISCSSKNRCNEALGLMAGLESMALGTARGSQIPRRVEGGRAHPQLEKGRLAVPAPGRRLQRGPTAGLRAFRRPSAQRRWRPSHSGRSSRDAGAGWRIRGDGGEIPPTIQGAVTRKA